MLVLSRKMREKIILRHVETGEEIIVGVSSIRPDAARIGIQASRDWNIAREEKDDHRHPIQCPEPSDEELSLK